jgi:hypothetical protein
LGPAGLQWPRRFAGGRNRDAADCHNVTRDPPDGTRVTLTTLTVFNVTTDFGFRTPVTLTTPGVLNVTRWISRPLGVTLCLRGGRRSYRHAAHYRSDLAQAPFGPQQLTLDRPAAVTGPRRHLVVAEPQPL